MNTFQYDGLGRRIQHSLPGGQSETFGYDPVGNLICYTNFNGAFITNVYDLLNRLTARIYPNGTSNTFTYTLTGQRQTMTDASGNYTNVYDSRDRLCTNSTPQGTLFYTYDANGNVTNIMSSTIGGTLVAYQYDALNRLTNVIDSRLAGAQNTAYGFDAVGNLQRIQYPNSVTNQYQYDSLNRLTNLVWKTNGNIIASFAYTLGATGNRTALLETNHTVNRGYTWNYDVLYRLTNETVTGAAPTGTIGYNYDSVGNRTTRTNIASGLGLANQSFTFNTNDWLASDGYDNNGNTLWSTNSTVQEPNYYDYENRLTNFNNGQVILIYDADGNRVKKITSTSTNLYLVDTRNPSGYAQVLEEFTVSNGATNLAKAYTYGLNLISQRAPGSSTYFFTYDGHGSTRMLTDAGGNFVNAFAYDAYGNLIASNGVPQTAYLYCGQQFDSELNLLYLRARLDNPQTGRFLTMDTFEGDNEDPLSLHKYLYCQANPVNMDDPSGHDGDLISLDITMSIGAGIDATSAAAIAGTETLAEGTVVTAEATEATAAAEASTVGVESATAETTQAEVAAAQAEAEAEGALTYQEIQQEGVTITERMSKSAFNKLVKSIQKDGIQNKIIKFVKVNGENYIVEGNNRLRAARKLGKAAELVFKQVQLPIAGFKTATDVIQAAAEALSE